MTISISSNNRYNLHAGMTSMEILEELFGKDEIKQAIKEQSVSETVANTEADESQSPAMIEYVKCPPRVWFAESQVRYEIRDMVKEKKENPHQLADQYKL